jgi:CubicO group peptidase (beta-lactamase class C family)
MRILFIIFLFSCFSHQSLATEDNNQIKKLDVLINAANKYKGFNGAMLVGSTKGNEVVYYNRIGFADKEHKIPLTDKHLFSAGSIGKEFSTLAIMKLVDEGKISYQDKVASYLPQLPSWAKEVSVEHIMSHTSGLPGLKWFKDMETSDVVEQVNNVQQLAFKPGQGYLYGNMNVVLRVYIVEAVLKIQFQEYLKREIFKVAGMQESISPAEMNQYPNLMTYHLKPTAVSGASFYTTPYDLYKFEQALWQEKFISTQRIKAALLGDKLSGYKNHAYFDFGSFYTNAQGKLISWEHDAGSKNHGTIKFHDFESNVIIVLMSNDYDRSTLRELKRSILHVLTGATVRLPLSWTYKAEVSKNGFDIAFSHLQQRIKKDAHLDLSSDEDELIQLGYGLLKEKKYKQAGRLFQLNLQRFPDSANAHDSYADALIKLAKRDEAERIIQQGLILAKKQKNSYWIKHFTLKIKAIAKQKD